MAGVTDVAFRQICAELGAGIYHHGAHLLQGPVLPRQKDPVPAQQFPGEHPAAVQIFGSDPICMAEAAQIALEHSGADVVDLNMAAPWARSSTTATGPP